MRAVVHTPESTSIDVAVHLRGRERAVPEQLLDRPQVGAPFEQVRREGMAKPVRMGEEPPQRARIEPPAPRRQEERIVRPVRERRPRLAQVTRKNVCSLFPERHHPLLSALPAYVHGLLLEIHISEVEVDSFLRAQAGRVHELDERAVSQRQRSLAVHRRERRIHLRCLRCVRQPPGAPGRE